MHIATNKHRNTSSLLGSCFHQTVVLCSHGPVLPDILDEVADAAGSDRSGRVRRASLLSVGEFAVVHLSKADPTSGIVAIETHAPVID